MIFFRSQACVYFLNVVFFSVGDDSRGGSPGAQRFQEKTRLRAGDIRGFTGGKLKVGVWVCGYGCLLLLSLTPLCWTYRMCVVSGAWWCPAWSPLFVVSVVRFCFNCYFRLRSTVKIGFMQPLRFAHLSILLGFLQVCLKYYEYEFMELACQCPAVVCCRCTPTQKAQIVRLLQERTGKLTCAVGGSSLDF